mmetsp:Transcript_7443/g.11191  ORF Transcript_7443/g.11191 Transcript_7443/m.11191 type:complete len:89 (-) Transcript_7443:528-794(-)
MYFVLKTCSYKTPSSVQTYFPSSFGVDDVITMLAQPLPQLFYYRVIAIIRQYQRSCLSIGTVFLLGHFTHHTWDLLIQIGFNKNTIGQ